MSDKKDLDVARGRAAPPPGAGRKAGAAPVGVAVAQPPAVPSKSKAAAVEVAKSAAGVPLVYRRVRNDAGRAISDAKGLWALLRSAVAVVTPEGRRRSLERAAAPLVELGLDTSLNGLSWEARRRYSAVARFSMLVWITALVVALACFVGAWISPPGLKGVYRLVAGVVVGARAMLGLVTAIRDCWRLETGRDFDIWTIAKRPDLWLTFEVHDAVQSLFPGSKWWSWIPVGGAALVGVAGAVAIGGYAGSLVIEGVFS